MYRNRRVRRLLFFLFFFFDGLALQKRVVTSVDLALALALATKSQIWSFFSICEFASFSLFLFYFTFFSVFLLFFLFSTKRWCYVFIIPINDSKKSFYEQSYFSFLLFFESNGSP